MAQSRSGHHAYSVLALPGLIHRPVRGSSVTHLAGFAENDSNSTNIGNAKILGMYKELGLSDYQYNLALSIFFVGYVIFVRLSALIASLLY